MNAFPEPEPTANERPEPAHVTRAARNIGPAPVHATKPTVATGRGQKLDSAAMEAASSIGKARPSQKHAHASDQSETANYFAPVGGMRAQLRTIGEMFADHQLYRIAFANRATNEALDKSVYDERVKTLKALEHGLALDLVRTFRKLYPKHAAWAKATQGIGEHTIARLLASTGHPRVAEPHHWEGTGSERVLVADEPYLRNVGKFWAYCGHGDPTRKPRKGMSAADGAACGNPHAKKLAWLLAVGAFKCTGEKKARRSPYRDVYDDARAHYEQRDDWSDGHKHNAAIRKTAKAILKDLWLVEPAELAPVPATLQPHPMGKSPALAASIEEPS